MIVSDLRMLLVVLMIMRIVKVKELPRARSDPKVVKEGYSITGPPKEVA